MAFLMFLLGILTYVAMGTLHAFTAPGNGYVNEPVYRATINIIEYIIGLSIFSVVINISPLAFFAGFTIFLFSKFSIKKVEDVDPNKKGTITFRLMSDEERRE